MDEYIQLLIDINRFCKSKNALQIVIDRDGFTLSMQRWDNPEKKGVQIFNETTAQAQELLQIPNIGKYFTNQVAGNCIYLTSTVSEN
jgi:hypothetical protein